MTANNVKIDCLHGSVLKVLLTLVLKIFLTLQFHIMKSDKKIQQLQIFIINIQESLLMNININRKTRTITNINAL